MTFLGPLHEEAINRNICPKCRGKGTLEDYTAPVVQLKRCKQCKLVIVMKVSPERHKRDDIAHFRSRS